MDYINLLFFANARIGQKTLLPTPRWIHHNL